jgi:type IV pilus assembly protein PilC
MLRLKSNSRLSMPKFSYIAKDKNAVTRRGVVDAATREDTVRTLQSQGLFVVAVSPQIEGKNKTSGATAGATKKKFGHGSIKSEDMCQFARQLSVLLSSGVTLLRSLEIVSAQTQSRKLNQLLIDVTNNVKEGLSLTEALAKYPRIFSSLWIGLIDTGEASGNLAQVLDKLASYLEMRQEFVRKITSALVYPAILTIAGAGAVFFFMTFIMPKFQEMFTSMNIELPVMTQILFGVSTFIQSNILFIIGGLSALVVGLKQWSYTDGGRNAIDRLQLAIPGFNTFFTIYFMERMCSTLAILFESGVPIVYALDVAIRGVGNTVIEQHLDRVKENVKSGSPLSAELGGTGFFPPMIVEMAAIGEEVGKLPDMFKKISAQYKIQLETMVERFTSMFEPIMIIIMGIGVGVIVISLFMPMFQMAGDMG